MDPSLSGTHNGGKQDGGVPFQLTTNKRNGNEKVACLYLLSLYFASFHNVLAWSCTFHPISVNGKDSVLLRIEKLPDAFGAEDFKGFIIQGVDEETNKIVGLFDVSDNKWVT